MKTVRALNKEAAGNWRGYLAAVGLVALATWLKYLAQPNIIHSDVPILYMFAIVPTAVFFGLGPSIMVCILSSLAFDFFFIPPLYTIGPRSIDELPILVIFLAVGVVMSVLSSDLRRKKQIAESEIVTRKKAEEELKQYQGHLEELVQQRTNQLEKAVLDLRASEERWATTLASIGDAVIATDNSGKITFMNTAAERLTAWSNAEAASKPVEEVFNIINEKTRQRVDSPVAKVLEAGTVCGLANHTILIRRDHTEVAIDDSGAPIKAADGKTMGVVLVFRDITERKKAEELAAQHTAEVETANQELEAFSYSVSHDLRAPLRGLDGFSQALLEDYSKVLDEHGKEYLNRIRESSQLMGILIDDMLSLSRVSRAEMRLNTVDLSTIAVSLAEQYKGSEPDRKAEFILSPDITVAGDKNLLDIMMRNLFENAWKYTGKCNETCIEFGRTGEGSAPVYYIKDNGAGFDMQYANKLFKPFSRLVSQKDYPGTGIGLATVYRIVRRHGGRIWAEAEPGKGATFYFTLGTEAAA